MNIVDNKSLLKTQMPYFTKKTDFQAEREERREAAIARFQARRAYNMRLREKNQKLRAQYIALLDQ